MGEDQEGSEESRRIIWLFGSTRAVSDSCRTIIGLLDMGVSMK